MKALMFCILLTGCAVSDEDINSANLACYEHDGLRYVWVPSDIASCRDGSNVLIERLSED